jgi:hypothetical protein
MTQIVIPKDSSQFSLIKTTYTPNPHDMVTKIFAHAGRRFLSKRDFGGNQYNPLFEDFIYCPTIKSYQFENFDLKIHFFSPIFGNLLSSILWIIYYAKTVFFLMF